MLSAVARYQKLLSSALARYFPRTTAYLRAEREAAQPRQPARKPAKKKTAGGKAGKRQQKADKPGPAGIYPAARLKVDDAQVQAMRQRVAEAVRAGLIGAPSDEQWAMILCRAPLTRIFAGAGSGKSSTLVLRVVFMLCHLHIDPARLTVISFTNASCAELRERLQRLLDFWRYPHDTRQCVRTFHSAMATLAKEELGNPRWFEQLDEPGEEPDNPLAGGRLRPAQQRLLKQAYQSAYAADARFRTLVHRLLRLAAPQEPPQGKPKAPLDACKLAGDRMDHRDFQQFCGRQRRQDGGKARGQHRLAGTRRPDHQEIVAAGGGDLQRPLGAFLPLDVGEIRHVGRRRADRRLGPRQHLRAAKMVGERDQAAGRDDVEFRPRPSGLGAAVGRADQALAKRVGADRGR